MVLSFYRARGSVKVTDRQDALQLLPRYGVRASADCSHRVAELVNPVPRASPRTDPALIPLRLVFSPVHPRAQPVLSEDRAKNSLDDMASADRTFCGSRTG